MPVNMADIPLAPQDIEAKVEPSEDGKPGTLEMGQDEVDAIIRNKRKVRDPKACYACHRRKVKCDRNLPCDSCVRRDHPELCSYERPTKKRRIALSSPLAQVEGGLGDSSHAVANAGPNITVPKEQWERLKQELEHLRSLVDKEDGNSAVAEPQSTYGLLGHSDEADRGGVHAASSQMGTMHLGSRSVLAYMLGNRTKSTQDAARTLLEKDILPNLGLDNETTTYPFVDLWSTDSSMQDVSGLLKALPDDGVCREFWLTYRDIPCIIYPVVPDAAAFEHNLNVLLHNRDDCAARGIETDPNRPYGVSLPFLALLFAVLASGSQSTSRAAKERELTSQVYICCSYQALRMANFLTHPCLETIEALLIIGNALSYNMNPGVSYIILGMTMRSAFSMGLHAHSPTFSEHENYLRSRIWWALAWQDSHFSVSYDRPSSTILCLPQLPFTKSSTPGNRTYVESMTSIIRLTQKILRERTLNPKYAISWNMIIEFKEEVYRIWREAMPRLRDRALCVAMVDHLERLALQIHCSYLISEICRPALGQDEQPAPSNQVNRQAPMVSPLGSDRRKSSLSNESPATTPSDPLVIADLRKECIHYLRRTVETYTELRIINKFAARSWIGIQRAISAAFLLGVLPDTQREPETIALLTELEKAIQESAMEDFVPSRSDASLHLSNQPAIPLSAEQLKVSPMWMRSMTKSLNALSKLNTTLAGGRTGDLPRHPRPQVFQPVIAQQAAAMYNTPVVSPTSNTAVPNLPINMQQYGFPPNDGNAGMVRVAASQQIPPVGRYTPDSTTSDWSFSTLPQHASGYIHTGIWGNQ